MCSLDFGNFPSSFLLSIRMSFFRGSKVGKGPAWEFCFPWTSKIPELTRLFPMASRRLFTSGSSTNTCSVATARKKQICFLNFELLHALGLFLQKKIFSATRKLLFLRIESESPSFSAQNGSTAAYFCTIKLSSLGRNRTPRKPRF